MARSKDESVPVQQGRSGDHDRSGTMQRTHPRGAIGTYPASLGDVMRDPFEMMRRLRQQMDRTLENFGMPSPFMGGSAGLPFPSTSWVPALEMYEREGELVVRAEMPGMNQEDFQVRAMGDRLVIEGERRSDNRETREQGYYQTEWSYGRFVREVPLPDDVDTNQVKARFENGVLEITVPFTNERRQWRSIPVESGSESRRGRSGGGRSEGAASETRSGSTGSAESSGTGTESSSRSHTHAGESRRS